MTVRSTWLTTRGDVAGAQTREDTRRAPVGTMTSVSEAEVRSGLIPGGNPYALTDTGAMSFDIGIGRSIIQGTLAQGAYGHVVTAAESFIVTDGDASLDRIDTVFAIVYDNLYDASGSVAASVVLVDGTPSATPTGPNAPTATAIPLYDIPVPAGTSAGTGGVTWATITDRRVYTVSVGGINPGGTDVAGVHSGQWRDNSGALERYDGATWTVRQPHAGATYESDLLLGSTRKLIIGGDTNLYRSAADTLKTDDSLAVGGTLSATTHATTTANTGVVTISSGWTLLDENAVKVSGTVHMFIRLQRATTNLTADSAGNFTDSQMFTVNAGWLPNTVFGNERLTFIIADGFGHGSALLSSQTGVCDAASWIPSQSITTDRWLRIFLSYAA